MSINEVNWLAIHAHFLGWFPTSSCFFQASFSLEIAISLFARHQTSNFKVSLCGFLERCNHQTASQLPRFPRTKRCSSWPRLSIPQRPSCLPLPRHQPQVHAVCWLNGNKNNQKEHPIKKQDEDLVGFGPFFLSNSWFLSCQVAVFTRRRTWSSAWIKLFVNRYQILKHWSSFCWCHVVWMCWCAMPCHATKKRKTPGQPAPPEAEVDSENFGDEEFEAETWFN